MVAHTTKRTYWTQVIEEVLQKTGPRYFTCEIKKDDAINKKQIKKRRLQQYSLGPNFRGIYLSQREAECVARLLYGYRYKKIASELGLSRRTVESYLNNVRNKMHCRTKAELIKLIMQSDFLRNYQITSTHIS